MDIFKGRLKFLKHEIDTIVSVNFPDGLGPFAPVYLVFEAEGTNEKDFVQPLRTPGEISIIDVQKDYAEFQFRHSDIFTVDARFYRTDISLSISLIDEEGDRSPPVVFERVSPFLPKVRDIWSTTNTVVNDVDDGNSLSGVFVCQLIDSSDNVSVPELLSTATDYYFGIVGILAAAVPGVPQAAGVGLAAASFFIPKALKLIPSSSPPRVTAPLGYGQNIERTSTTGLNPTNTLIFSYSRIETGVNGSSDKLIIRMGVKKALTDDQNEGLVRLSSLIQPEPGILLEMNLGGSPGSWKYESKTLIKFDFLITAGKPAGSYSSGTNIMSWPKGRVVGMTDTYDKDGNLIGEYMDDAFSSNSFHTSLSGNRPSMLIMDSSEVEKDGLRLISLFGQPQTYYIQARYIGVTNLAESSGVSIKTAGTIDEVPGVIQQYLTQYPETVFQAFTWNKTLRQVVPYSRTGSSKYFSQRVSDPNQYTYFPVSEVLVWQAISKT